MGIVMVGGICIGLVIGILVGITLEAQAWKRKVVSPPELLRLRYMDWIRRAECQGDAQSVALLKEQAERNLEWVSVTTVTYWGGEGGDGDEDGDEEDVA